MPRGSAVARRIGRVAVLALVLGAPPGCAAMRQHIPSHDLQPCRNDYAETADGWRLGVKRFRPRHSDATKDPVVLCHGLGLNGTFWTITNNHLPRQLAERGYDVFVVDMRGSGASHRAGAVGYVNGVLRQTCLLEIGTADWTLDDQAFYDVPAILDYVQNETGCERVNWVGHSLGGMIVFPYLELTPEPNRIGTFVSMGAPVVLLGAPERKMLRANRNLRRLLEVVSTSRIARPMMVARPPGLAVIDRLYYSAENVDRRTINRFYGFTLEDPGTGALRQLEYYLEHGRLVSADRSIDYADRLGSVRVPILLVAGKGDVLAPLDSVEWTYEVVGSPDKTLATFGIAEGHRADYGHCDLVWSRHAPDEVFPVIADWLDARQPRPTPQASPQR